VHLPAIPPWAGALIAFLVCGGALWKGALEERCAAVGLLFSMGATIALRDTSWPKVQSTEFLADVANLLLLTGIALRSPKYWPMAAAGFQLLAVMTHVAKLVDRGVAQWTYLTAGIIWTYLLMIALVVGTVNAARARREAQKAGAPAPAGATRR
jgi:hypothetical protein